MTTGKTGLLVISRIARKNLKEHWGNHLEAGKRARPTMKLAKVFGHRDRRRISAPITRTRLA